MATLGQLRTRILAKLAEGGGSVAAPTAAQVDAQINSSIKFYEEEAFWFSEATETGLTVVDDPFIPIPTDFGQFIQPDALVIEQSQVKFPVMQVTPLAFDTINVGGNGLPLYFVYRNGTIEMYFKPNQEYIYYLHYRKTYADLVADSDTNDFTTYAERLIEYKTLADCYADYRSDAEMATYYNNKVDPSGRGSEYQSVMRQSYERSATGNLTTENVTGRSRTTLYER